MYLAPCILPVFLLSVYSNFVSVAEKLFCLLYLATFHFMAYEPMYLTLNITYLS